MTVETVDLSGIPAKMNRAMTLIAEMNRFYADHALHRSSAAPLTCTADFDRGGYVISQLREELPNELSAIFGDALHNMRTALDYLARQLVIANGSLPEDHRGQRTAFPISLKAGPVRIAPKVSDRAQALVRSVQPFEQEDPQSSLLWRLNELDIIDKHRLIAVFNASTGGKVAFGLPGDDSPITDETRQYPLAFHGEDTFIPVDPADLHHGGVLRGSLATSLVLGREGRDWQQSPYLITRRIWEHLSNDVFPLFDDCFEEADLKAMSRGNETHWVETGQLPAWWRH